MNIYIFFLHCFRERECLNPSYSKRATHAFIEPKSRGGDGDGEEVDSSHNTRTALSRRSGSTQSSNSSSKTPPKSNGGSKGEGPRDCEGGEEGGVKKEAESGEEGGGTMKIEIDRDEGYDGFEHQVIIGLFFHPLNLCT